MASIAQRQGMRALVTRPREESEMLASALAARGIGVVIEPMMEVHYCPAAGPDLAGVQALLCTSANGVRALARASGERGVPLFAVGDATAARARDEGFAAVTSAGGDAAHLVRVAAGRLRPQDGRLLHISGNEAAGDLAGALRGRGFTVERCVLYEARANSMLSQAAIQALRSGAIDFALFFSPRTAGIFARLADDAGVAESCRAIAALSISTAADAALDALSWRERQVAERPNQGSLLDVLDRLLAGRGRR
jgi:uroporphyrinogen-III synthase